MKHCNTLNDTMYKKPGGMKLENLVQLLLLMVGLSGVFYISRSQHQKSDWPGNTASHMQYSSRVASSTETFRIEGSQEAGAPILLIIKNYDENEYYVLDTGAGNKIVLDDPTTTLRFPAAGVYDLKLWVRDGDNWQLACREQLYIDEQATVVSN